ncbi:MAG: 3-isopropylmalate dehydratase large subunit [Oscillospiraceae bacterium]|jgi:3-isopropylmalate/(R)-2-methylmalate dehydratase large subunit|nr:3-isopropylmalate dehydratase large subunit [Oscillospiraceae bacterium]
MGKTLSEKLLARAAGAGEVKAGDIIWADVDVAMMDDILGPRVEVAQGMAEIRDHVWDTNKVVIISDHYTPPATIPQAEIVKFTRDWAAAHGIKNYYEFVGPCHQIMVENGHVLPGKLVLGTDSHTCMGGALGAFASGVGSTEMLGILISGKTWLKVPETIKVTWNNKLPGGVMAKDLSLKTISVIGHSGATYKTIEYVGDTIASLPIDERLCICNMAVEMGAKTGIIPADESTLSYLRAQGVKAEMPCLRSDADAEFSASLDFDARTLEPLVACPHAVDNVQPAACCGEVIHQAYLGSCTGGRYYDLAAALKLLKGKKIAKNVRLLVSPASRSIWNQAQSSGILSALSEAGATILAPTCGVCVGVHSGLLAAGECCISASNRNFIGRMGSREARIFLGSPLTVAASAVTGRITDPRELL